MEDDDYQNNENNSEDEEAEPDFYRNFDNQKGVKNLNRNKSAKKDLAEDYSKNKKKLEELNLKRNNNINNSAMPSTRSTATTPPMP